MNEDDRLLLIQQLHLAEGYALTARQQAERAREEIHTVMQHVASLPEAEVREALTWKQVAGEMRAGREEARLAALEILEWFGEQGARPDWEAKYPWLKG